ncbi:LytTR family DNA-binding domain-containing protein [Dyadobacter sp. NIV53]|uniref:LytR/AlgR family response regulator transcription factor n=1 Tax=Dyadobacter sp. NIV53 TaxID=2861765 RepID=UPI001E291300|nr:response regulator [Dyadobacter sp. NIV53]
MMNCVIVDDEPLAREGLTEFVQEVDFLCLSGTCENPVQLARFLETSPVDLIFLDIQMPKMSGLDYLKIIKNPPMVILTTAFPNYAVEGFQLNVLDYLLKPITFERFFLAVNKAKDYHRFLTSGQPAVNDKQDVSQGYFFIRCGSKYERIFLRMCSIWKACRTMSIFSLSGESTLP